MYNKYLCGIFFMCTIQQTSHVQRHHYSCEQVGNIILKMYTK